MLINLCQKRSHLLDDYRFFAVAWLGWLVFSALGKSDRSGWSLVLEADKRTLLATEETLDYGTDLVPSAQAPQPCLGYWL